MILQRRNVELLAVIALNMGSERTLDGDFGNIWDGIKAVRMKRKKKHERRSDIPG